MTELCVRESEAWLLRVSWFWFKRRNLASLQPYRPSACGVHALGICMPRTVRAIGQQFVLQRLLIACYIQHSTNAPQHNMAST